MSARRTGRRADVVLREKTTGLGLISSAMWLYRLLHAASGRLGDSGRRVDDRAENSERDGDKRQ